MREQMEARLASFRYAVLPSKCPKCEATGPWLAYDRLSLSCLKCGKTCYLAAPKETDPLPLESQAEKAQRLQRAGRLGGRKTVNRLTPQQLDAHMTRMRNARTRV